MGPKRTDQLTRRERDCLGLVGLGRSSKEIALELGISPFTVDEYIRSAIAKLGVQNRREAARALAEEGAAATPEKIGDEAEGIAAGDESAPGAASVRGTGASPWRLPFLRHGRRYNDLTTRQRLVWIFVGAIAIIVLFAQLSQGMAVLQAMFRGR